MPSEFPSRRAARGKDRRDVAGALERVVVQTDEQAVPGDGKILLDVVSALTDRELVRGNRVLRGVPGCAAMRDQGLPGFDIQFPALVFDMKMAVKNDRKFVEIRGLPGLGPALRTAHMSHADGLGIGTYTTDILIDQLRLIAGGSDTGGLRNQRRHRE